MNSSTSSASTIPVPIPPVDRSFEARSLPGKIYDVLGSDIVGRPKDWLGSGDVSVVADYHLVDHQATRRGGWTKTSAHWNDRAEEEVRTSIFGELCGEVWGKKVSARGTWVPGWNEDGTRKVIDDTTSVKNRLVVRGPTRPTNVVDSGFSNQVCEFRAFEDAVIQHSGSLNNSMVSIAPDGVTELLNISMEQIYKDTRNRPRYAKSEATSSPKQKQKVSIATLKSLQADSDVGSGVEGGSVGGSSSAAPSGAGEDVAVTSNAPRVNWDPDMPVTGDTPATIGATYPVTCLPDHRGPDFEHRRSVVAQPEVWSIDGNLVHPRDLPYHLKAGVLLLMEGKFCVWHTPSGQNLVSFVTDAIKIIADSDEEPELPSTEIDPSPPTRAPGKSPAKRTAAFTEFGSCATSSSPPKKNKVESSVDETDMFVERDEDSKDEEKPDVKKGSGKGSKKDKGKGVAK